MVACVGNGCQPGLVVLLVFFGSSVMLHENHRRRLVFMPGIPRDKAKFFGYARYGRNRREPTTVDALGPKRPFRATGNKLP